MPPTRAVTYGSTLVFNAANFETTPDIQTDTLANVARKLVMTPLATADHPGPTAEYDRIRYTIIEAVRRSFVGSPEAWGVTLLARMFTKTPNAWPLSSEKYTHLDPGIIPTIYIICPNPVVIESEIAAICSETWLRVEVHQGGVTVFSGGCVGYERRVSMGRSISCTGSAAVGTLGGWVTDVSTGEKLAITAGHVVMGNRIGTLSRLPHTEHGQQVVQPADHDWDGILQEAERSAHKAYEKSNTCGFLDPKLNQKYEKAQSKLSAMKALAHSRELGVVTFGTVGVVALYESPATHGAGRETWRWKDYALISANPDRTGECSFGYIGTTLTDTDGSTKPRGGLAVKKSFTRSTGPTSGHINGVLLDTNLSSVLLRDPTHSITSEWVAIGCGIPEMSMSAIGDSGGLLTDDDNAIVGMIIGGLPNRRVQVNGDIRLVDNLTIFTSAEELLQWIKFDLGRDVVFEG